MNNDAAVALNPPLPLLEGVVARADTVVRAANPAGIVAQLVHGLRGLWQTPFELPELMRAVRGGPFRRRELYRSDRHGCQFRAIELSPGYQGAVHDHANASAVKAVPAGGLELLDYFRGVESDALLSLRPTGQPLLGKSVVVGIEPPHDLHACRNIALRTTAVSLHVQGEGLTDVRH